METNPNYKGYFLPVFLPSFFLLAAMGMPGLDRWNHHLEAFGSGNYYLVVRYAGAPEGVLANGSPVRLTGSLVTPIGEVAVSGQRIADGDARIYRLDSQFGTFEGRVISQGQCPATLKLTPVTAGQGFPTETLRSGLCL